MLKHASRTRERESSAKLPATPQVHNPKRHHGSVNSPHLTRPRSILYFLTPDVCDYSFQPRNSSSIVRECAMTPTSPKTPTVIRTPQLYAPRTSQPSRHLRSMPQPALIISPRTISPMFHQATTHRSTPFQPKSTVNEPKIGGRLYGGSPIVCVPPLPLFHPEFGFVV